MSEATLPIRIVTFSRVTMGLANDRRNKTTHTSVTPIVKRSTLTIVNIVKLAGYNRIDASHTSFQRWAPADRWTR